MSVKTIATQRASMNIPTGRLAVWWVLVSEIVIPRPSRELFADYL
jgi:hypothetical protein